MGRVQVLFLNMESDIGAVAAYIFAHNEAIKGMQQMLFIIEDAWDCTAGDCAAEANSDKDLVNQVRLRCRACCPECRVSGH